MHRLAVPAIALALTALLSGRSAAQTIPVRTVPVASGDQFRLYPSRTAAMGGVSLAVDDSLADGWSNPALGALNGETAFLGSPTYYSIADGGGGGRTLPVAALFAGARWFGGASLALQEIEDGDTFVEGPWWGRPVPCCGGGRTLSERFNRNLYASAYLGRRLAGAWSVGAGVFTADLGAMDGVDLLYLGSDRIDQSGSMADVRVGAFRDGERDRLSLVLLHSRLSMTHDVSWSEWVWDDDLMQGAWRTRVEKNEDRTRTWGGHAAWDRALTAPGWRVGASATMNYKDHPKIPDYTIQNIPRDPGTTWAYEAAFGFSRTGARGTFALDVALQPIWSATWQLADATDAADSGGRLRVGDRSIENDFFFTNVVVRSGLSQGVRDDVELMAGLEVRSYAYTLEQLNHVTRDYREQDESWIEWSPTFGAVVRLEALELRYTGRITTGTGRPRVDSFMPLAEADAMRGGDFLLAPEGALILHDVDVTTHQLAVRVPIR